MKEGFIIEKINKNEVNYLISKGINFKENGISKNHIFRKHRKKYYLCETIRNMKLLNEYRKSIIIKSL